MNGTGQKFMCYSYNIPKIIFQQKQKYFKPLRLFYRCSSRVAMLRTWKIDSPSFKNIFTPELKQLVDLFTKYQHELRIAGGAVRDILMDKTPHDIDFATTATPTEMKAMFEAEGVRMINTNGESHGTITARINDKENFEVTTLRVDVVTDGRRAKVEFTKDWMIDANRRDLTINAMFLGFDGTLSDYFNGKEDLAERKVRFVGEPKERIQEDYLRILRYFRFYGRIADRPDAHEEATLKAIEENCQGLKDVSGERLWMELKQIISGHYACDIIKTIISCNVSGYLGFPEKCNTQEYEIVCANTQDLSPRPMTRIAALFYKEKELYDYHWRVKLSNDELSLGAFIIQNRDADQGKDPLKFFQYLQIDTPGSVPKVHEKICELLKYKGQKDILKLFMEWTPPKFPLSGNDLINSDIPKGPIFKMTLDELRQIWKFSDFTMTREDLLQNVKNVSENVKAKCKEYGEEKKNPKAKKKKR